MTPQELNNEIKSAMKAKDTVRLSILRQVLNEVRNIEVNERRDVTQEDVDNMLKRTLKQTNETLDASIKAANDDERTKTLEAQVQILNEYLPKQVSGDELKALVDTVIVDTNATSMKDMGAVMKELNARTGGNIDKAQAAAFVKEKLS